MNNSPLYEQLIAQKLQQLPVPDMADAIWATIETQLDIDMPTDGPKDPPSTPPKPPRMFRHGLRWLSAIIVVVAIIVINRQHRNDSTNQSPMPTIQQSQPAPAPANQSGASPPGAGSTRQALPTVPGTATPIGAHDSAQGSPVLPQPVPAIQQPDSTNTLPIIKQPPIIAAPVLKDSVPPKKQKGVKGISDKDYRLTPVPKDTKVN